MRPLHTISEIAIKPELLDEVVVRAISDGDSMYRGNPEHYFGCGRDAVRKVAGLLTLAGCAPPSRILDFACGYGRVARYLAAAFPSADLSVSDISESGMQFCVENLRAKALKSDRVFSKLSFTEPFSLIWCGSLITHLDEDGAKAALKMFVRSLAPGGLAIFTTHGRYVGDRWKAGKWPYQLNLEQMRSLSEAFWNGEYAYMDYDHMKNYGISITPLAWVAKQMSSLPEVRLTGFIERGWDNHQDVVALLKTPI